MQHVYTLPYPHRDGSYGSNRGSTVADVQAPHSQGCSTVVQGILLLKTLEHGLSGDPPGPAGATSQRGAPKDGHTHRAYECIHSQAGTGLCKPTQALRVRVPHQQLLVVVVTWTPHDHCDWHRVVFRLGVNFKLLFGWLLRPSGGRGYEEGEDLGKGTGVHGVDVPNWYGEKEEAVRVTKGAHC